jgi:hypothetical protein
MDERSGCALVRPQGGENQIGWTDVNFQCGGAGHNRGNKDQIRIQKILHFF